LGGDLASSAGQAAAQRWGHTARSGRTAKIVDGFGQCRMQLGRDAVHPFGVLPVQGQAQRHEMVFDVLQRALQVGHGALHGQEFLVRGHHDVRAFSRSCGPAVQWR
jgi:hypothetical protein